MFALWTTFSYSCDPVEAAPRDRAGEPNSRRAAARKAPRQDLQRPDPERFDFLGYRLSCDGLRVAKATIQNFVERAARLYEEERGNQTVALGLGCMSDGGSAVSSSRTDKETRAESLGGSLSATPSAQSPQRRKARPQQRNARRLGDCRLRGNGYTLKPVVVCHSIKVKRIRQLVCTEVVNDKIVLIWSDAESFI